MRWRASSTGRTESGRAQRGVSITRWRRRRRRGIPVQPPLARKSEFDLDLLRDTSEVHNFHYVAWEATMVSMNVRKVKQALPPGMAEHSETRARNPSSAFPNLEGRRIVGSVGELPRIRHFIAPVLVAFTPHSA